MLVHFQTIWTITEAENQLITDQSIWIKRQPAQWGFILTGLLNRQSVWGELHPISVMSVLSNIRRYQQATPMAYGINTRKESVSWIKILMRRMMRSTIITSIQQCCHSTNVDLQTWSKMIISMQMINNNKWPNFIHFFKKMSAIASMVGQIVLN